MTVSTERLLIKGVFVVRKTSFNIIVLLFLFLVLVTSPTLAVYDKGCCISPVGLAGSLDTTQEACTQPNLWVNNCYEIVGDTPQFDSSLFFTACCCLGNTVAFASEASAADKEPSDILTTYCNAQEGYTSHTLSGDDCEATCSSGLFTTENVLVEGTVINVIDKKGLSDINVVLELDDKTKFNTTTINGKYNFTHVPKGHGYLTISSPFNYPLNCTRPASRSVVITGEVPFDFTMSCTFVGGSCQPEWIDDGWEDCVSYEGVRIQRHSIHDENDCGYPVSSSPYNLTRFCDGAPLQASCGDGVVNNGEQCDVSGGNAQFRAANGSIFTSANPTCVDLLGENAYGAGTVACTPYCTYDLSDCAPSCGESCDNIMKCGCDVCANTKDGRALCHQNCLSKKPEFIPKAEGVASKNVYDLYNALLGTSEKTTIDPGIAYTLHSRDVNLSWSYDTSCNDQIMGFKLVACEEGNPKSCLSGTQKATTISSVTERVGAIKDVLEKEYTSYCYNVCAITTNGEENCAYDDGELPCFLSGDTICMEPTRESGYNCERIGTQILPVGCNVGGEVGSDGSKPFGQLTNLSIDIKPCANDADNHEICVETEKGDGAECRQVTACEQCNGLFGLYANYDLNVFVNGESLPCSELQFYGAASTKSKQILSSRARDAIGLCYKDKTLTTQPAFSTCENVTTCYAYKSEEACMNDPCMHFQGQGQGCEWTSFNEELGIGVCAPKDISKVECGRCDTESPLGFCTQNFCQDIYGKGQDACYYDENHIGDEELKLQSKLYRTVTSPLVPTCVNKKDMGCYFYDTKKDCEGGYSPSYNITYDISDTSATDTRQAKVISGTNKQLTESKDYFGFGDCYWDTQTNKCLKNANGYFFHSDNEPKQDDCRETHPLSEKLSCFTDNQAPNTTILWKKGNPPGNPPVYGITELANLSVTVTDNKQSKDNIRTYFSLTSGSETSYPTYTLDDFRDIEGDVITSLTDGTYTISYFSEDVAKNMEPIRSKVIRIDTTSPTVAVTSTVKSIQLNPDLFVSDVTIHVHQVGDGEQAHCKIALYDATDALAQSANDVELMQTTLFSTTYVNLRDGLYTLKGYCSDDYGNKEIIDESVLVNGDKSVSGSYPLGEVFKAGSSNKKADLTTLVFKLTTANSATCFVSPIPFGSEPATTEIKMNSDETGTLHSIPYAEVSSNTQSGAYTYYVKCIFSADGNIVKNDPADAISFTIDNEPPSSFLQKKDDAGNFLTYNELGENWGENKYFRISCDDANEKTPFSFAGCGTITYCLGDSSKNDLTPTTMQDYCDSQSLVISHLSHIDIIIKETEEDLQTYGKKYLYYYSQDKFGNQEPIVHTAQLRIRNTKFDSPTLVIR